VLPYKGQGPGLKFFGLASRSRSPMALEVPAAAFVKEEEARWRDVIKSANVMLE